MLGAAATAYVDSVGLAAGTSYYYRVTAFNAVGPSAAAVSAAVVAPAAPAKPTGLSAAYDYALPGVRLTWVDAATDETGYRVRRSTNPDFSGAVLDVTLPAGSTAYDDRSVSDLTRYYYRVTATGPSAPSAAATVAIDTPDGFPETPAEFDAFGVAADRIDVQWDDAANNETGYVVERADGPTGSFAQVAALGANATHYSDLTVAANAGYRYRVRATGLAGPSAWTAEVAATTLPPELTTKLREFGAQYPDWLTAVGSSVYFTTSASADGQPYAPPTTATALWRTDGTAAGTTKVFDGEVSALAALNGSLFFARRDGTAGDWSLWLTDGTAGLSAPFATASQPYSTAAKPYGVVNGRLVFGLYVGNQGDQLWATDGTAAGTVPLGVEVRLELADTSRAAAVLGGNLYFARRSDYGGGYAIWKTDGTPSGTAPVTSGYADMVVAGGRLYFPSGSSLYAIAADGTMSYVAGGAELSHLAAAGGRVFMRGTNADGAELWVSDGTAGGTQMVADLGPEFDSSNPMLMTAVGNDVYFVTRSDEQHADTAALWRTDGTKAGTKRVRDLVIEPSYFAPTFLTAVNGTLYFGDGHHLWRSDGTGRGTVQVAEVRRADQYWFQKLQAGRAWVASGDRLFFTAEVLGTTSDAAPWGGRDLRVAYAAAPAAPSEVVSAADGGTVAAAPSMLRTALTPAAAGPGVRLSWRDNAGTESGFVVERSDTSTFDQVTGRLFAPADATGLTDPGGAAGAFYRVRAVNAAGSSAAVVAGAPPAPVVPLVLRRAAADAYVRDGTYAGTNYGGSAELHAGRSSTAGATRESYLRFDLSQVGTPAQITSAKVRVYGTLSAAGTLAVALYPVAGTTWTEAGVKWSNKPATGTTALSTKTLSSTGYAWFEFDVTSYLKQQRQAGATTVAFALKGTVAATRYAVFASDEASANRPELRIAQQATVPPPTPTGVTLRSPADAFARDGTYAANKYGSATALEVRRSSAAGNTREAFLRFDLSAASATVTSAKLRLYGKLTAAEAAGVTVQVFKSTNTTWSESTVAWASRPLVSGSALKSVTVSGTTAKWYEVDLTAFVKAELAGGRKVVTLVLKASNYTSAVASFNSDEATGSRPELVVK